MRDDYKLVGSKKRVDLEVESEVAETLEAMARYSKHSASELANTALKRFMCQHKDFLPDDYESRKAN